MTSNEGHNRLAHLIPELQVQIFQALPNLHSAIALRLTCSQLNAVYLQYESSIRAALRDRIVQAFDAFYTFLTTLHIPPWALKRPPAPDGCWPHITREQCVGFDKTDFAFDVLRHLPYLATHGRGEHCIEYGCHVLDYAALSPASFTKLDYRVSRRSDERFPRHTVHVATNYHHAGTEMALDTLRAEMGVEVIPFWGEQVTDVAECLGAMRERCRNLEIMFVPGGHDPLVDIQWKPEEGDGSEGPHGEDVGSLMAQEEDYPTRKDARWIRYLYRKAGWPGPEFQKERALRAVRMFVEARIG